MSQPQSASAPATIFRHRFSFGASPDLIGLTGTNTGYVIRHAINGDEQQSMFVAAMHNAAASREAQPDYSFEIEAPEGSVVTILISARDEEGNASKAVPFEFRITGKRILRHPGAPAGALAMVRVYRPISLKVVSDEQPVSCVR